MPDVVWTWDPQKADDNRSKHGVSFETAGLVFDDPCLLSDLDPCEVEARWRTIGMVLGVLLFVVHTEPQQEPGSTAFVGRIISARKATRTERRGYHNG
ncbi:BrnT family toxin [Sphingopyxis sp. SCN 67-31]|uniref:BrnT family toxin n=1 Tax=Sphingopyxis sp. SCN 67-31 TaxID=1660142 RepID=UPI00257CE31D|nr:BrnT family toxin [Sphingopyxis sp. SCN 67-31]